MAIVGIIGTQTHAHKALSGRPLNEGKDIKPRLVRQMETQAIGVEVKLYRDIHMICTASSKSCAKSA
jgi:hypothetical protein